MYWSQNAVEFHLLAPLMHCKVIESAAIDSANVWATGSQCSEEISFPIFDMFVLIAQIDMHCVQTSVKSLLHWRFNWLSEHSVNFLL